MGAPALEGKEGVLRGTKRSVEARAMTGVGERGAFMVLDAAGGESVGGVVDGSSGRGSAVGAWVKGSWVVDAGMGLVAGVGDWVAG